MVHKYLLRRLAFGVLTILGVSIIIFVVMRILPGDPLVAMFGMEGFTKLGPADRARIMQDLGLSDPLYMQYAHWMKDLASGKLGVSFFRGDNVADLILRRGPLSAEIGLLAVLIPGLWDCPWALSVRCVPTALWIRVPGCCPFSFWLSRASGLAC
jgi:peptide/nickel transport system permease protein